MLYCRKPGLLSWKSRIRLNICALRPTLVTSNFISPLLVTFIDREGFMLRRTFKSTVFLVENLLTNWVSHYSSKSGPERTSVLLSLRSTSCLELSRRQRERERSPPVLLSPLSPLLPSLGSSHGKTVIVTETETEQQRKQIEISQDKTASQQ